MTLLMDAPPILVGDDLQGGSLMDLIGAPTDAVLPAPNVITLKDPTADPDLLNKALCLAVTLRQWGTRRKVDTENVDVEADKKLIHVSKEILDSPEMKKISHHMSQVRAYLQRMALPSQVMRRGLYLVAAGTVEQIDEELEKARVILAQLVEELLLVYPAQKAAAKTRLNGLFNEKDYPTPEALREMFQIEDSYVSLQAPTQLAQISQVIYNRQLKKEQQELARMFEEVRQGLRSGLQDLVEHLVERLTPGPDGKPKTFKGSTVKHMQEFLQVFDAKNITDDASLKELVAKAKQVMDGVNPETLRKNEGVRQTVLQGLRDVKKQVSDLVVTGPARMVTLED